MAASDLHSQFLRFPGDLLDRPCLESHLGKLVHFIDVDTMVIVAAELELTKWTKCVAHETSYSEVEDLQQVAGEEAV